MPITDTITDVIVTVTDNDEPGVVRTSEIGEEVFTLAIDTVAVLEGTEGVLF